MFKIMFALHLVFAIFAIGPLVHAVTTASRALRHNDAAAAKSAARMTSIYAIASVLVIVFGFALMSSTSPYTHTQVARFSETWIWLSLVLWAVGSAIAGGVIAPTMAAAGNEIAAGRPVGRLTPRVAAAGGVVGVIFVVIVFLMVYQPGG